MASEGITQLVMRVCTCCAQYFRVWQTDAAVPPATGAAELKRAGGWCQRRSHTKCDEYLRHSAAAAAAAAAAARFACVTALPSCFHHQKALEGPLMNYSWETPQSQSYGSDVSVPRPKC